MSKPKDIASYLTLFKVPDHTTYRTFLGAHKDSFDVMWKAQQEGVKPKITERKDFRIDRVTGEINLCE